MADAEQTPKTTKLNLSGWLGIVDRAWEATWAARVICLALFFDTAMLVFSGSGLISWAVTGTIQLNFGWMVIVVVAYCLLAGLIFPTILEIIRSLTIQFLPSSSFSYECPSGSVYASAILDKALRDENQFLLDYYKDRKAEKQKQYSDANTFAGVILALLFLAAINGAYGVWLSPHSSIVSAFFIWSGEWGAVFALLTVAGALSTIIGIWTSSPITYIYQPELAREQQNENRRHVSGHIGPYRR